MTNNLRHTEADLFSRFRNGSEIAFTTIYHQYYKRVYYFAQRYLPAPDAQDVTADVFLKLWSNRQELESMQHISSFLFVVARNQCLTHLSRNQLQDRRLEELRQLAKEEQIDFTLEPVRIELISLLKAQISALPEKTRNVFLLSFQEGLKPAQIAEQLGVSVKTVKNQKVNALKLLKQSLSKNPLEFMLLALLHMEGAAY